MFSNLFKYSRRFATTKGKPNPYESLAKNLTVGSNSYKYYAFSELDQARVGTIFIPKILYLSSLAKLPYSIRVLLECAVRNCDEFKFHRKPFLPTSLIGSSQGCRDHS